MIVGARKRKPLPKKQPASSRGRRKLYAFSGTFDGQPCELIVWDAIRAGRDYACRIQLTYPVAIDREFFGATPHQARELAFGLCHSLLDRGEVASDKGKPVEIPGPPLPRLELDDGQRSVRGLALCLVQRPRGRVRLVLDDAQSISTAHPQQWTASSFYTYFEHDEDGMRTGRLPKDALAAIGQAVLTRLGLTSG
jgi:hypothetical protein